LGYQNAFAAWTLFSIVVVTGCAHRAWNLYSSKQSSAPALLSLLFGPTLVLLMLGQFAVLVLLGVTLFLDSAERRRDLLSGASILLILVKPHIALLFLIAIVLWAVQYRRWSIILSAIFTVLAASALMIAINPHLFVQYLDFVRTFAGERTPYPNLGGFFYASTGQHVLAFIPELIGIAWLVIFWRRHRTNWDWKTDGILVLLVSVACSYYSFPFDKVVILPAMMAGFATGDRRTFLVGFVATNLGYALYISNTAGRMGFGPLFLWWTASAWLITYLFSHDRQSIGTHSEYIAIER
jgi:hypothetical protein